MARFIAQQWDKIEKELVRDPAGYGMPEGGREESMILASFNIRKLGSASSRKRELEFMARFCARCDLVAIQEVMDNLDALRTLKRMVDERVASAGEYEMVVSDITGREPGRRGMAERLAFLYRKSRISRLDMTSDLTFDRTAVMTRFNDALKEYEQARKQHAASGSGPEPKFKLPEFVTFARTPFVTAFEAPAPQGKKAISFIAVNAHLIYGTKTDRKAEFQALATWIAMRLKADDQLVAPNFILLGDLNLDLDNTVKDRKDAEDFIAELKKKAFGNANAKRMYFPFIGDHPVTSKPIRTNARQNQTFDQIGFFLDQTENNLPKLGWANRIDPSKPDEFDFGVFNFADLFSKTIKGKPYARLNKADVADLGKFFEHKVSDHMPIWVRIPRPGFG